jgi:P-type Cu+ transporter
MHCQACVRRVEKALATVEGAKVESVEIGSACGRAAWRIMRQNLFWALGYNVVAIPAAASGF